MHRLIRMQPLKLQNLQIGLIIRAFGCVYREFFFAYPTPFMFAHIAYHVRTATIFLDSDAASLA